MSTRKASHAGSWYTADSEELSEELDNYIAKVPAAVDEKATPIPGARVIIAPHAGYSYSGPAAAWAYKSLDLSKAKRVFLLGPNHQQYYNLYGLAISSHQSYSTPFGDLSLDLETIKELHSLNVTEDNTKHEFSTIPKTHDEKEHSLEMHLPYIYKMMSRTFDSPEDFPPIIPIMVGAVNGKKERVYGKMLAPYLQDPTSVFIVSSDFCHWGGHFQYFYYMPDEVQSGGEIGYELDRYNEAAPKHPPIHESIHKLDKMGMEAVEQGNHQGFLDYLATTHNTICGRHPIGVVMAAMECIRKDEKGAVEGREGKFKFVRYERSNNVVNTSQYSVSYASAYAVL